MFFKQKGKNISSYQSLQIPSTYVFVRGLRDRAILDRLFEEDDINFDKTIKIVLAMERATKDVNDIMSNKKTRPLAYIIQNIKYHNLRVNKRKKSVVSFS